MNGGDDIRQAVRRDGPPPAWALGPDDDLSSRRMIALGQVIGELREQRMLDIAALAARADLPESTVTAIEQGRSSGMPLGCLYAIAAGLGVTPSSLLDQAEKQAR